MKKTFIILLFIVIAFFSNAQIIKFHINGEVIGQTTVKYAYLTTLTQQRPKSSDKIFEKVPIVDGKFRFDRTFDLNGEFYQEACVFLDARGDITKQEVASKFYNLIWIVGRDNNLKHIILENMDISFKGENMLVVKGGAYTKQFDELSVFYKQKTNIYFDFVKKYPDSPVSFYGLKEIYQDFYPENYERAVQRWGNPYKIYNLLSQRLKNSKKSIQLKKDMDNFLNK